MSKILRKFAKICLKLGNAANEMITRYGDARDDAERHRERCDREGERDSSLKYDACRQCFVGSVRVE